MLMIIGFTMLGVSRACKHFKTRRKIHPEKDFVKLYKFTPKSVQ